MSRVTEQLKFLFTKGLSRRGDEETDAFSDDEGRQDTSNERRSNKEAVQLARARAASIRERIPKSSAFRNSTASPEIQPDTSTKGSTRYTIPVDGVSGFSERTIDEARQLDRESHTTVRQTTVNARGLNGFEQRVQQTQVTYDLKPLLESFEYAKTYKLYLGLGVVALGLFVYFFWSVYTTVVKYM